MNQREWQAWAHIRDRALECMADYDDYPHILDRLDEDLKIIHDLLTKAEWERDNMITFTKLLEKARTKEIAIHAPTEKQAKALLKELGKRGFKWSFGRKLTDMTCYENYEENTCYTFDLNKEVWCNHLSLYQKLGYTSIEFSEIDFKKENKMITFTKLLEKAKTKEIVIHTPTENQAKALLKALDKRGYTWLSGMKLTDITRYESYEENTCYEFNLYKKVLYCSLKYYQNYSYTTIEFTDIDFEEK